MADIKASQDSAFKKNGHCMTGTGYMNKIFIVEDDNKIIALLADYFKQANFDVSTFIRGDAVIDEK